jgi:general secretion pathway protein D
VTQAGPLPWLRRSAAALALALAAGCATTAIDEANRQSRAGAHQAAYDTLQSALAADPDNAALKAALLRQRERLVLHGLAQADLARANGRLDEARRQLEIVRQLEPGNPRVNGLTREIDRGVRHDLRLAEARTAIAQGRLPQAEAIVREVLAETPGHPGGQALRAQLLQAAERTAAPPAAGLGPAFQKPVSLEFRDAPLRQVFEALARTTGVNFVFDRDVRGDARITVFLRNVTLDEAVRVVLSTQALDRKLLNESTVLIFPNTQAKQREHQELVTRSLFLRNVDAKQALTLVRTMAKTRDLHADDRLNALIVRDTPEVVRLVEQLLATIDLPDPEVVLDVEVMEIATDRLLELGLQWPSQFEYTVPGVLGSVPVNEGGFKWMVATPAVVANLRSTAGAANLLANPSIRARSREKARVQIGQKLPVFTTTSTANVGVSTSVSYLDVGLKLEVEPTVQLDGEVTIRLGLEVSNLLGEVRGPQGSIAYQVGTRATATSLRLADGETQIMAGLISDEDRRQAAGIPGLVQLPVVGRLFGVHSDSRSKTEIVMLMTPRIVRTLPTPDAREATLAAGTDTMPGAPTLRLRPQARAGVGAAAGGRPAPAASAGPAPAAPGASAPAAAAPAAALVLASSPQARIGDVATVTLVNRSALRVRGELAYDDRLLQPASPVPGAGAGRLPFTLEPRAEFAVALRPRPDAAGQTLDVSVVSIEALDDAGQPVDLRVEGEARFAVPAAEAPK